MKLNSPCKHLIVRIDLDDMFTVNTAAFAALGMGNLVPIRATEHPPVLSTTIQVPAMSQNVDDSMHVITIVPSLVCPADFGS